MSSHVYYKKLDNLQHQIYTSLDSLTTTTQDFDSTANKHLHQQLLKYKDYLRICKHKLATSEDFHTFELYQLRYSSFKKKLREILMDNHSREAQLSHEFRIKQFGLDKFAQSEKSNTSSGLSDRDQLFGDAKSRETNKTISELSMNHQIAHHNKQITQSLQTSRQLLSATILQSELNLDSLDQQTKDLHKLNEGFVQFSTLLNRSQQIVKFIEKQDKTDKQRIYMSGAFFLSCCCWVIYRRVLRTSIRLMLWSFFKIIGIYGWLTGSKDASVVLSSSIMETSLEETVSEQAVTSLASSAIIATTILSSLFSTSSVSSVLHETYVSSETSSTTALSELIDTTDAAELSNNAPDTTTLSTVEEQLDYMEPANLDDPNELEDAPDASALSIVQDPVTDTTESSTLVDSNDTADIENLDNIPDTDELSVEDTPDALVSTIVIDDFLDSEVYTESSTYIEPERDEL